MLWCYEYHTKVISTGFKQLHLLVKHDHSYAMCCRYKGVESDLHHYSLSLLRSTPYKLSCIRRFLCRSCPIGQAEAAIAPSSSFFDLPSVTSMRALLWSMSHFRLRIIFWDDWLKSLGQGTIVDAANRNAFCINFRWDIWINKPET
jgi:hypothetical protein